MSCTGPTLYPVVLSSIDGECVFAEYDLSSSLNVTNWQNIHDVVMWCCPWLYYDDPDSPTAPGPIPTGSIKPNTTDPATTYTIWMHSTGKIGDSNFPQGEGLVDHSNQFNQLAGGGAGVGTDTYWEEVNPSHEALFYLELGNEVETSAAPAKITMSVSSVSGGPEGYKLGIDPTQTVSYSGTSDPVASWGTAGSSKWSYKMQPANNRSLESLVNVKAEDTSGATNGQLLTFNGTRWQASAAPTGGGESPSFALSDATDSNITTDDIEYGDLLVYNLGTAKWDNVHSLQINSPEANSTMAIPMIAGQTSAVFAVSDSGGNEVFKMNETGDFIVSGNVSASIVSATEGTFLTVTGIDHGGLGGLSDDDHPQYVLSSTNNNLSSAYTNHAASTSVHFTEGSIDHGSINGLSDDDHPQYVLSSTNNNLSSAYTNHAASTSVHFTEGSIDHGSIGGLGDDDHTQYHNDTRGDARYYTQTQLGAITSSSGASLIGLADIGSYTEATDVEGALQEIYPVIPSLTWSKYISYADQSTFWSGSTSYTSNPGVSNATNKQRAAAGTNFTDGAERGHIWQLVIPAELDVTQPITATVYGRMGSAGGEGDNIEIEWSGAAQADNESMTTGTASTGAVVKDVSTYSNNDSIQIDLGTIWSGSTVAEGEFMHMTVFRDAQAGNTDDTFAGTFQYFGVELQGTRKPAFTTTG